ncbi:plasmid replication initiator TrfA [Piscirickettsia salmonis]|uniref:plasmid replication initiator TrfA n=1 Tax=Piscirickettsia salmonis TaxID=1238 RepID=UPI0012BB0E85|nr:plasmid replication initiator TrfA [Piscirickettsia salmonis]QGP61885.1 Plasmid replication initiator protein TrfA [Piscirickettsia salmonis]
MNNETLSKIVSKSGEWGDELRYEPHWFGLCSLFKVGSKKTIKKDKYNQSAIVHDNKQGQIKYSGCDLYTSDEDLWMEIIHNFRDHELKNLNSQFDESYHFEFSAYEMAKALSWPTGKGGEYLKRIHEAVKRLSSARLALYSKKEEKERDIALLPVVDIIEFTFNSNNEPLYGKRYKVEIDKNIAHLYSRSAIRHVLKYRKLLKPLEKRLNSYLSCHRSPFPIKVSTYRELLGSDNKSLFGFKQQLKSALNRLKAIGLIYDWNFDKGRGDVKVYVIREKPKKIA